MEQKTLGNTDLKVSKICLGTMTWGNQNTPEEAFEQLNYALEQGVNFIDAAEIYPVPPAEGLYGHTENIIGKWFSQKRNRADVVLATKMAGKNADWIRGGVGLNPDDVRSAVDESLRRLQTDTIDLYQLHWPQRPVPLWGKVNFLEEMESPQATDDMRSILEALQKEIKAGKIRYVGLSNETAWGAQKFLSLAEEYQLPRMQSIQNAYNLLRREYDNSLAEVSLQENIGLLAYSPLGGGILSGKYRGGKVPKNSRYDLFKSMMGYYFVDSCQNVVEEYAALANDLNISLAQLSLSFVNDRSFVTSNIIGATTMEQLKENIYSADITLSAETRSKIEAIFSKAPNPATY